MIPNHGTAGGARRSRAEPRGETPGRRWAGQGRAGHSTARPGPGSPPLSPASSRPPRRAPRARPAPARRRQWAAALGAGGSRGSSARPDPTRPGAGRRRPRLGHATLSSLGPRRRAALCGTFRGNAARSRGAVAGLRAVGQEGGSSPAPAPEGPPKQHCPTKHRHQ